MKKITLLSDTHGLLDGPAQRLLGEPDEIWHAGDIGPLSITDRLEKWAPVRAVYGNIDDHQVRSHWPEHQRFTLEGVDVWITHIGGYPGRYDKRIRAAIREDPPDLFISGHSHILKVMRDQKLNLLHMNPGALGKQGFHHKRTLLRFQIEAGRVKELEVGELPR